MRMPAVSKRSHTLAAVTGALLLTALAAPPGFAQDRDNSSSATPSGPIAPADTLAAGKIFPSTLVDYVHTQNHLQPDWNQGAIAAPLLPLAMMEGLTGHEKFFLGQLYCMGFKPNEAYAIFSDFADRDDWYGWLARQRLAIMDTRAFENFKRLEKNVMREQENFRLQPEYASIVGFGERSLCNHWSNNGDHDRAADFALETVKKAPRNAAYYSLELPRVCFGAFKASGRESEAFSAAEDVLDDLTKTLDRRARDAGDHTAYDPDLFENTIDDRWYGRSEIAPYNYINFKLEQMIGRLESFLACHRDGEEAACSG